MAWPVLLFYRPGIRDRRREWIATHMSFKDVFARREFPGAAGPSETLVNRMHAGTVVENPGPILRFRLKAPSPVGLLAVGEGRDKRYRVTDSLVLASSLSPFIVLCSELLVYDYYQRNIRELVVEHSHVGWTWVLNVYTWVHHHNSWISEADFMRPLDLQISEIDRGDHRAVLVHAAQFLAGEGLIGCLTVKAKSVSICYCDILPKSEGYRGING
ncbi:hypothetical protein C8F01DRAFT_1091683 [Mycena amicta]|nr:hypothetical protein C8F01DRAFT_1091683 [Mycena amicta]